jgi:hypothetical protein
VRAGRERPGLTLALLLVEEGERDGGEQGRAEDVVVGQAGKDRERLNERSTE